MDASKNLNGFGTWRRYKLGQAQFTSWLKQTAEKLVARKPKPEPNNGNGDAESQQSQGQKKKKKKAKQPAVGLNFDTETDKSVHWSQLEVLAQRIADNAEPEDVPESAVNILRDVVGLRKKSFKFFSRATKDSNDEKVKQSNANHAHIITVLEQVLAKLEAFVSAKGSSGRKESKANAQINTSDLTNMFSYLEVHTGVDPTGEAVDEVESGDEAASVRTRQSQRSSKKKKTGNRAKKPKKAEKPLEKSSAKANNGPSWVDKIDFGLADEDEEDDEFDLYMMVYCFFEDFNSIRNHIAERWCDYWYDRSVSLNTLAVITNAAFELFHQLEHDLVKELRPVTLTWRNTIS